MTWAIVIAYIIASCLPFCRSWAEDLKTRRTTPTDIFLPLTELPLLSEKKQREINLLTDAVFPAHFEGMHCTGTFISHQGHFLTADHCIQGCFTFPKDEWQKYIEYRQYEDPKVLIKDGPMSSPEFFVFKRFRTEEIRDKYLCTVEINGETKMANLVAAGKGRLYPYWPSFKSKILRQKYNELQAAGVWAASDFAVLQLIEKPNTACIQLGDRAPLASEKLRALSYTCINTPLHPNNYEGKVPLYTEGIVAPASFFTGSSAEMLTAGSTPANTFWTNLAGETCSSGSSVIGSDGKILGVMNMLEYGDEKWGPITDIMRISGSAEIRNAIKEQTGEAIDCER